MMDDKRRAALRAMLDEFDKADRAIDAAMAPFRTAQSAITAAREVFLEQHEAEVCGACRSCDAILLVGDSGHVAADDGVLCAACAPTWGDLRKQIGETADDAMDPEDRRAANEAIEAHLDRRRFAARQGGGTAVTTADESPAIPVADWPKEVDERVLIYVVHPNHATAGAADRDDWAGWHVGYWTDFNGGGWVWHGMLGTITHVAALPPPP